MLNQLILLCDRWLTASRECPDSVWEAYSSLVKRFEDSGITPPQQKVCLNAPEGTYYQRHEKLRLMEWNLTVSNTDADGCFNVEVGETFANISWMFCCALGRFHTHVAQKHSKINARKPKSGSKNHFRIFGNELPKP